MGTLELPMGTIVVAVSTKSSFLIQSALISSDYILMNICR